MKPIFVCGIILIACFAALTATSFAGESERQMWEAASTEKVLDTTESQHKLLTEGSTVLRRQKRSCYRIAMGNKLCEAHCILISKRGGSCNNRGLCVCRK